MTDAFLKGHVMNGNRGTLMVLKRILVTALSALGLGALAIGTASGQTAGEGNIPAPNIFDDQITCSMLVPSAMVTPTPSVTPMGAMESPLDILIGMGNVVINTAATGTGTYEDLGYVIPPQGMNCGLGATGPTLGTMNVDGNDDGDFIDVGDTLAWGNVPKDVADGYTALLDLYVAVYGGPGGTTGGTLRALQAAQKSLTDVIEAGSTGAALTPFQNAVTRAQEAHTKALTAFRDGSAGPIYQAGVAEWHAKAAVTKAVVDYNTAVGRANEARTGVDGLDYGSYVPLGNNELVDNVVTFDDAGMATIVASQLKQYANADEAMVDDNSGTISTAEGTEGVTTTTGGNFTVDGRLIVPMELKDHDGDDATDEVLRPVVVDNGTDNLVSAIRTQVERVNAAATALEKLRDDNVNPNLQLIYNEAARRARAEADYYNAEWAEVLGDTTNQNTVTVDDPTTDADESVPFSIASRNAAFQTQSNRRLAAEQTLRAAVADREDATAAVRRSFSDAQQFYEQLVARRQALKVAADKAVTTASTTGTAPKNLLDAAEAAQMALTDAQEAKDNLDALFANEDDPSVDLITELLKTGGNDGQALVDAISSNYDSANEAKEDAEEAMTRANEVSDSIAGLTGDDGEVSMNTANIKENTANITGLDGRVTANEEEIGMDDDGNSRIDHNEMRSMANATEIGMDDDGNSRIDHNEMRSMANATEIGMDDDGNSRIDHNEMRSMANATEIGMDDDGNSRIDHNEMRSKANAGAIFDDDGNSRIATNATNIMTNATNIADNAKNIMDEATARMEADTALGGRIDTNATDIMTNDGRITANAMSISSNADAIAANMSSIGSNRTSIMRNADMIGGLQDQMEIVRAGVAASMALAGMPAINGRGIAIGVGSYDGESAFAVGFQIQSEMASFKVGVSSSGGETGASAGVGFQF